MLPVYTANQHIFTGISQVYFRKNELQVFKVLQTVVKDNGIIPGATVDKMAFLFQILASVLRREVSFAGAVYSLQLC